MVMDRRLLNKKDTVLRRKVKSFIRRQGRYCTAEEILKGLNIPNSRVYLSYRGVDVTEVNKELGFIRRPKKKLQSHHISKEDALSTIRALILEEGRYLPRKFFRKTVRGISDSIISDYDIDLPAICRSLGFSRDSRMARIHDKDALISKIRDYIKGQGRYVSQQEITEVFKVSLGFITKNVDTISMNRDIGFNAGFTYFESVTLRVLEKYWDRVLTQKTFPDCRSSQGYLLRFDFFIEPNILIEADGAQHWDTSHRFYSEELVGRDLIKNEYASSKGLVLIRIPFKGRWETSFRYIEHTLLETLKSLITTKQLEITNLKVRKALGLDNQQPSL